MNREKVEKYLEAHQYREIVLGKSGARVWEIDGKLILKFIEKERLSEPEIFNAYQKEAQFYQYAYEKQSKNKIPYLPEIIQIENTSNDIMILMKKYKVIDRKDINESMLQKVMHVLAQVHTHEIPEFLIQNEKAPELISESKIEECLAGWREVLEEHPGRFDESILLNVAKKINDIILWHSNEQKVLCHGDFHWENLLQKENGELVICDWQGVNIGGAAGDISFFISRLGSDGVKLQLEKLIVLYAQEIYRLTGKEIKQEELLGHIYAANIITTFLFWHMYLHGSTEERVEGIYCEMSRMFSEILITCKI